MKLVRDFPALFLPEKKILVIADLHLGIEHEFFKSGIVIPSQAEKFKKEIDFLIETTKAKKLLILGDIKHKVPGVSLREMKNIENLFSYLTEKVKLICAKGNHDDKIEDLLPKNVKIISARGASIGKYAFFHGHAWPFKELMKCDYLIFSHIHPAIEFKDKFGYRNIQRVWVKGRFDKNLIRKKYKIKKTGKLNFIIVPAFNKLVGSIALNSLKTEETLSLLKFTNLKKCKIYFLDGTFVGKLEDLNLNL